MRPVTKSVRLVWRVGFRRAGGDSSLFVLVRLHHQGTCRTFSAPALSPNRASPPPRPVGSGRRRPCRPGCRWKEDPTQCALGKLQLCGDRAPACSAGVCSPPRGRGAPQALVSVTSCLMPSQAPSPGPDPRRAGRFPVASADADMCLFPPSLRLPDAPGALAEHSGEPRAGCGVQSDHDETSQRPADIQPFLLLC